MAHVRPVQRKTGQAFEVRWKADGKDRQRTFSVKREAERFAARVTVEVSDGASTDQHRKNTHTVSEAWEIVAADDALRKKRSTLERYDQVWRNQVEPRWGSVRVRDVAKKAITEWAGVLLEGGLSSASSLKAVQVLSKAMGQAVDEGWATANPAQRVRLSKAPPPIDDHVVLTPEQIDRVAEELAACPPYDLLVRFAAWTGLRAGELTALRRRDVNPLSGEVAVVRTMYRDPKSEAGWRVDTPKTRANRSVAIYDDRVVADLRRYVAQHPNAADPEALLWPGRLPGSTRLDWSAPFDHRVFVRRTFGPASRRAGLPEGLTWHMLRHASASILLAAGLPVWVVSRNLGHASTATTEAIYAHAFDNRDHSAERAQVAAFRARRSGVTGTLSALGERDVHRRI